MEVCGQEGIEALAQARVTQGGARQPRLEEREHPTLCEPGAHLIEGMMPVQNRQNPGVHAPATRAHMCGVRRQHAVNDGGNSSRAEHAQDHGHVGHKTDPMHRDRHEQSPPETGFLIAIISMRA